MKYTRPSLDLLEKQISRKDITPEYIESTIDKIQKTIDAFAIQSKVVGNKISPLNTIFELETGEGVKIKTLRSLQKNIEVELGAPIKVFQSDSDSKFCIAVPHSKKDFIRLSSVLTNKASNDPMVFTSGIDEYGKLLEINLANAPHMLIAGSSGTGKTVFIDDIIMNILLKASPDDIRLVLIDPTYSDFKVYSHIPHLLCPVLHNKADITDVLGYITEEIKRRNALMKEAGVKDFLSYIQNTGYKLNRIVIIIDKFMEFSFETPKEFKTYLKKISAMGRSVGIHLIINSQTPNTRVVPGDIKANMKYRVSFSLTSAIESRSMIDKTGAEKLHGTGELIFYNGDSRETIHAQAAYISYNEIKKVVSFVAKTNLKASFDPAFNNLCKDYAILEDIHKMKRILETIIDYSKFNIGELQKQLDITLAEAYETISILMSQKYITNAYRGYHDVNYALVMKALKQLNA